MVSRTVNLQPLVTALTAAGVPLNVTAETDVDGNNLLDVRAYIKALKTPWATTVSNIGSVNEGVQIGGNTGSQFGPYRAANLMENDLAPAAGGNSLGTAAIMFGVSDTDKTSFVKPLVDQIGSTPNGYLLAQLETGQGVKYDARQTNPGLSDTIGSSTEVTTPAALQQITVVTPGVAGDYTVLVAAGVQGTTGIIDTANIRLRKNTSVQFALANPTGNVQQFGPFRFGGLTSTDTLNLQSIAAGTVGSQYVSGIYATRLG